ncbi:cystathionine beta-lyase [Psychromarinibacter halotolerans]|uniref:Cystathionine beta-lyase n=1 Tax=Psychromarinibacter halotolerans TaxID=1775175 RepID=A0ABV7GVY9_9RHOB|nr:cystathionine beta-lyase [Psychromarinibacter halotolerans]MDF0597610.1 cystathionine beta-lyase [Psychromarinibacter halotolerans]
MTGKTDTPADQTVARKTSLLSAGRDPAKQSGAVNPPVYRASTIVFRDADHWMEQQAQKKAGVRGVYYGRHGTPTSHAFEDAMCELEGGSRCFLFPSGLSAVYHALAAFAEPGKTFLLAKNCYYPSKRAATELAAQSGMTVTFFDPMDPEDTFPRIDASVALVLIESPGSNSFEVCDVDAITKAARAAGCRVALDNTWATPLLFRPLEHGVDLSIQALTKYVSGHSDLLGGSVTVNAEVADMFEAHHVTCGACLSGDESYSALKGLRTLAVRLREHGASALALAEWLQTRPEPMTVRHPALPDAPGHDYWRANFDGASGLFSVDFEGWGWEQSRCFINALRLFGLGASWGGYESLVLPCGDVHGNPMPGGGVFARMRFNIGLEDTDDLRGDIEQALNLVAKTFASTGLDTGASHGQVDQPEGR